MQHITQPIKHIEHVYFHPMYFNVIQVKKKLFRIVLSLNEMHVLYFNFSTKGFLYKKKHYMSNYKRVQIEAALSM